MRAQLIRARNDMGKTQQQVADEVGISRAYYTNIEGDDRTPSLNVAQRIAESVGRKGDMTIFSSENVSDGHSASA